MSKLRAKNIEPATGTTLTLGASGDAIAVSSDSVQANTWQDTGGNSLFVSDGSGTLSSVNSGLGGGGYTLLSTSTITTTTQYVEITTGIDSTYDEYMFVMTDLATVTDNMHWGFQGSIDGGSNYNDLTYEGTKDQAQGTAYQPLILAVGNAADKSGAGILHLFKPSNTTYVKQFYCRGATYEASDYSGDDFCAGYFNTTSAINAVRFGFETSTSIANCVIQMYGVS